MSKLNLKKRGLGRGLDALFEDTEDDFSNDESGNTASSRGSTGKKTVPIGNIIPGKTSQPRENFDETALEELATSIKEHGLIQPILVRPVSSSSSTTSEETYEIVAGERRWRAAQKAQLHEVPVIIRDMDDKTALQIALIENLQREDLNAIEEAKGYKRLLNEFEHSTKSLAQTIGKSNSHVKNTIRLLQLPDSVQELVSENKLSAGHARAILTTDNPEILAREIIKKNLSVRQAEELAAAAAGRGIKKRNTGKQKRIKKKDTDTIALEHEVSSALGMNVSIDMSGKQKGKISISFETLDQLDDVLHRLSHYPGHKASG